MTPGPCPHCTIIRPDDPASSGTTQLILGPVTTYSRRQTTCPSHSSQCPKDKNNLLAILVLVIYPKETIQEGHKDLSTHQDFFFFIISQVVYDGK